MTIDIKKTDYISNVFLFPSGERLTFSGVQKFFVSIMAMQDVLKKIEKDLENLTGLF